jgi:hypothetical protein
MWRVNRATTTQAEHTGSWGQHTSNGSGHRQQGLSQESMQFKKLHVLTHVVSVRCPPGTFIGALVSPLVPHPAARPPTHPLTSPATMPLGSPLCFRTLSQDTARAISSWWDTRHSTSSRTSRTQ